MPRKTSDIESLISGLTDFQKDAEVERLLDEALAEPLSTEERLRHTEQILEAFKGLGLLGQEDARDLHLLLSIGRTYERFSHLDKAYETYERALGIAERLDEQETLAQLLCRTGRVLSRWGRWDESLAQLERSRRAYERLEDRDGLATVALNRGIVFQEQGHYDEASAAYEEAREAASAAENKKILGDASNNLAVLATIRGDLDHAVWAYGECLSIFEELEDKLGQARTLHNLGMTHADRRDWPSAMDAYERGFKLAQDQGQIDVMANIHLGTAEVLLELGGASMALCYCARALDIYRQVGDRLGEADTYRLLGRGFAHGKQWQKAESMFRHGLQINEECDNPLGVAETLRDLGRMQIDHGLKQEARETLETALGEFRRLGAQADTGQVEALLETMAGD